jgi:hypothetical protein
MTDVFTSCPEDKFWGIFGIDNRNERQVPNYIDLHDEADQEKKNSGLMYLFYVNYASVLLCIIFPIQ